MSRSNSRIRSLAAATALALAAIVPAMAQTGDPNTGIIRQRAPEALPDVSAECTAYAIQTANEEFMARDSTLRHSSPFQSDPRFRDPYTSSQQQQLEVERTARQRQIYDACIERLQRK